MVCWSGLVGQLDYFLFEKRSFVHQFWCVFRSKLGVKFFVNYFSMTVEGKRNTSGKELYFESFRQHEYQQYFRAACFVFETSATSHFYRID